MFIVGNIRKTIADRGHSVVLIEEEVAIFCKFAETKNVKLNIQNSTLSVASR
jgi:hypothetical protein